MRPPKTAPGALRASQEAFIRLQNAPDMCTALRREHNFEKSIDLHEKPQHTIWPTVTRFEHILAERHFLWPSRMCTALGREHNFQKMTQNKHLWWYTEICTALRREHHFSTVASEEPRRHAPRTLFSERTNNDFDFLSDCVNKGWDAIFATVKRFEPEKTRSTTTSGFGRSWFSLSQTTIYVESEQTVQTGDRVRGSGSPTITISKK